MTVKDLAEFTGKTDRTIRNWANLAAEKISAIKEKISASTSTYPANYELDEVEQILLSGSLSADAVSIIMENAKKKPSIEKNEGADKTAMLILSTMDKMQERQERFMEKVLSQVLSAQQNQQIQKPSQTLQIEATNPWHDHVNIFFRYLKNYIRNERMKRSSVYKLYLKWGIENDIETLGKKQFYSKLRKIENVCELKRTGDDYFIIL